MNPKKEIRLLKSQVRKEKKINERLRKRLDAFTPKANGFPQEFTDRIRQSEHLGKPEYFSYLYSLLRRTQVYTVWERAINYFRRFRLVSLLFRTISYLTLLVQFGTAFFFAALVILILLPVILLGALGILFSAIALYRVENRKMKRLLDAKEIVVFFPTREGEFGKGRFWSGNLSDIATRKNTIVLIVSPFFWSGRGFCHGNFYFLGRKETENIYILRRHYYFSLYRRVLDNKEGSVAFVY